MKLWKSWKATTVAEAVPKAAVAVGERKATLDRLAAKRLAASARLGRLREREATARAREAEAARLHCEATAFRVEAELELMGASADHEVEINTLLTELRRGAHPQLTAFRSWLLETDETARLVVETKHGRQRSRVDPGVYEPVITSNLESVTAARQAIRAAFADTETMLESALTDDEIENRLEALERDVVAKVHAIEAAPTVRELFTPAQLREIAWSRGEST